MSQERDTSQQQPETPKGHWTNSQAAILVFGSIAWILAVLCIIFAMLYGFYSSINERLDRQEARYIAALQESDANQSKILETLMDGLEKLADGQKEIRQDVSDNTKAVEGNARATAESNASNAKALGEWSANRAKALEEWSANRAKALEEWSANRAKALEEWSANRAKALEEWSANRAKALEEWSANRAKALEEWSANRAKALEEMKDELGGKIDGLGRRMVVIEESVGALSSDITSLKAQLEQMGGAASASWMFTAPTSIPFHMDADALKSPVLTVWADDIAGLSPEFRTWLAVPLFTAPTVLRGDMGTGTFGHLAWASSPEGI